MMRQILLLSSLTCLLGADGSAPAAIIQPKWRGAIWASAVTQDRQTADGSVLFRPLEAGEDSFSLDGLILGADADLGKGWSFKTTLLGGQFGKIVNAANAENGTIAIPEAMLVWTSEKDTLRFGRMITFIGMEFLDGTQNVTASRGLLYTFADPFTQVGLNWHHAFTPSWSTDVWAFNGEDRIKDNNRGKTYGLGLTYNHGGATDKYVSVHAYRGPEQDGFGTSANTGGAEGRMRERLCMMGQWTWGPATLVWEASTGKETFTPGAVADLTANDAAKWAGFGAIFRYAVNDQWGIFLRAETLKDDMGVRLSYDPNIAATWGNRKGADLRATNLSLGMERKFGQAFLRFEVRQDSLNRELVDQDGKAFKRGSSATFSMGASF